MLGLGLGLRLYDLTDQPIDFRFHPAVAQRNYRPGDVLFDATGY